MTPRLRVDLYGHPIGELVDLGARVIFRFFPSYWQMPERPVLGRWFEDGERGEVYTSSPGALPAWFANVEPEGALARQIAQRFDLGEAPLELLSVTGSDLPGAVRLVPETPRGMPPLAELRWTQDRRGAASIAGVQLKHSVELGRDDRLTLPLSGAAGSWLLKVPPPKRWKGIAENEHATMRWAARAAFDVPETQVVAPERVSEIITGVNRLLYLVRRFDRTVDGPIHQEDVLQAAWLPPEGKYPREVGLREHGFRLLSSDQAKRRDFLATHEGLAQLARHLMGSEGVRELIRRVVLEIATGNGDAHLKNWSLLYRNRKRPTWSPLYDQVSTVAWGDERMALPLFGKIAFRNVHTHDLVRLGVEAGLEAREVQEAVEQTLVALHRTWEDGRDYPLEHARRIRSLWRKAPLTRHLPVLAKPESLPSP